MKSGKEKYRRAFTVVEVLIALAISGILFAAITAAFNAFINNYQQNKIMFDTSSRGRSALSAMTTRIRTGSSFDPSAPTNSCSFFTSENEDITYEYRENVKTLYLITNSNGNEYVLCDNVDECSFAKTPTDDGLDVKSVQISMTITDESGTGSQKLSAAAVVRKNLP